MAAGAAGVKGALLIVKYTIDSREYVIVADESIYLKDFFPEGSLERDKIRDIEFDPLNQNNPEKALSELHMSFRGLPASRMPPGPYHFTTDATTGRSRFVYKSGFTGYMKGNSYPGEAPIDTTLREFREEVGVDLTGHRDTVQLIGHDPATRYNAYMLDITKHAALLDEIRGRIYDERHMGTYSSRREDGFVAPAPHLAGVSNTHPSKLASEVFRIREITRTDATDLARRGFMNSISRFATGQHNAKFPVAGGSSSASWRGGHCTSGSSSGCRSMRKHSRKHPRRAVNTRSNRSNSRRVRSARRNRF